MTPKEKAIELVNDFNQIQSPDSDYGISWIMAIQVALKTVDEIIKELLECGEVWMKSRINYWQSVKSEIEKL